MGHFARRAARLPILCVSLAAAAPAAPGRVVWREGVRAVFNGRELTLQDPASKEAARHIELPAETIWASWRPEGVYALVPRSSEPDSASDTAGKLQVLRLLPGAHGWERYANLPKGIGDVRAALPMSDGRLFLVPNGAFLSLPDGSQWAPFLILGQDAQHQWRKVEPVFLEWGPPFRQAAGNDGKPRWFRTTRRYSFLSMAAIETPELSDRLFELENGWAFVDRHHGQIWIFDDKGALKRRLSIYDDLKDTDLDLPGQAFPQAILACEAAPDDVLIIAARNDVAFFFSRKVWPRSTNPADPPPAANFLAREAQAAKDFPDLAWLSVNTRTGDIRTLPAPSGQPSKYTFHPEDPNWHFHFKVSPEGQVTQDDARTPVVKPSPARVKSGG